MTADGIAVGAPASARRPYAPSWIHALDAAIDRLPGPAWLARVVIGLLVGLLTQLTAWANGRVPAGELDRASIYWVLLTIALLWSIGFFRRLAESCFDAFRPALRLPDVDGERLRYELSVIPQRDSLVIAAGAALLTAVIFASVPDDAGIVGVPVWLVLLAFVYQLFLTSILFSLGWQLLRQMRLVRRAFAAAAVDLFRPGPLHALSRLTAWGGATVVLMVNSSALFVESPTDLAAFLINAAPFVVVPPLIAVIAFVVPLIEVHGRLDREKDRLLDATDDRLKRVLGEVDGDVATLELSRADGLNKLLASVVQEREILGRLPTWPWSTSTLRGFVSAILLPLVLFVIQLLVSRVL